ncbi:hypothetical protein ANN_18434 [Periplaneta americana]|uniref:Uncharacterized protein n=1 Tax=Periplaneta americana TaxID=6978 RepID=A0ABQ8SQ05_PERAM|nr:hypothetical protein ANN_18434 [Periplaneta americana]
MAGLCEGGNEPPGSLKASEEYNAPALVDDGGLHPRPGGGELRRGEGFLLQTRDGAARLVVVMVVVVQAGGRGGVLVVVEAEHEASGTDPARGTGPDSGRRVQLASPRGRDGIQLHGGRGCRRRCRRGGRQRQRWPRGRRGPRVTTIAARKVLGPRLVGRLLQLLRLCCGAEAGRLLTERSGAASALTA